MDLNLQLWDFSEGLKNKFETAVIKEPSVFEPLKVYCIMRHRERWNLYYSKFAKDHFYNVISALPSWTYFQISGKSMLEINSEMQSKSFIIFPLSTLSTHASEYDTLKNCHSRKRVDGTSMCMPILTLVLRISLSHYCFFFSKPMYFSFTIEFWENFRKLWFLDKNVCVCVCVWGGRLSKNSKKKIGSNCSSFILQLNAETQINIRAVYNEVHVFKLFLYVIYMAAILSKFWVVYKNLKWHRIRK